MKHLKTKLFVITGLIIINIVISCKKEKKDTYQPKINISPNCQILSPKNNNQISKGEIIIVKVSASDKDGEIEKVDFYINEELKNTKTSPPYLFEWNTKDCITGDYTIKAKATDNGEYTKTSSINISLISGSYLNGDTVYPGNLLNASGFTIYTVSGEQEEYLGFLTGTNGYGDVSKAQEFKIGNQPYSIKGSMMWFGAKHILSNANIQFKIWNMDGTTEFTSQGSNSPCPGTVLVSKDVSLGSVDTSAGILGAHIDIFETPIKITNDYALGIGIQNLYSANDSIALVSSLDGDGNDLELSWEQWSINNGSSWATLKYSYDLDIDIAIFPILDSQAAKVGSKLFFEGMQMSVSKRHFSRNTIAINYALEKKSKNTTLEIFNTSGKSILKEHLGTKNAGKHTLYLNKGVLKAGSYIYVLQSGIKKLIKEFLIQ